MHDTDTPWFTVTKVFSSSLLFASYNVCEVSEWVRDQGLAYHEVTNVLKPVIQAAKLLQVSKKTRSDAQTIVELCTQLHSVQVG